MRNREYRSIVQYKYRYGKYCRYRYHMCPLYVQYIPTSVADPGSDAFSSPGSGVGFFRIWNLGFRIPNPYF
jgi:hypothetical protein